MLSKTEQLCPIEWKDKR